MVNPNLRSNNQLQNGETSWPNRGDVVLVTVNKQGNPEICGLPDLKPQLNRPSSNKDWQWDYDPLARFIGVDMPQGFEFDLHRLRMLLACTSGALPFTVEFVNRDHKIVYLSRREQTNIEILGSNRVGMATVQGVIKIRQESLAILRYGHTFLSLPMNHVVSGVPSKYCSIVASWLQQNQIPIWLRRDTDGSIITGLYHERQDIQVRLLTTIKADESDDAHFGVLCRSVNSECLYWMPSNRIGWGSFTYQTISTHLVERLKARVINVSRFSQKNNTDIVSLADVRQATYELSHIQVGSELLVMPLGLLSGNNAKTREYIVESFTSGILFTCEVYDDHMLHPGTVIPVEVIDRVIGLSPIVRTVPTGTKRQRLDLPNWLLQQSEFSQQAESLISNFPDWLQEETDLPDPKTVAGNLIHPLPDEQIKRWLTYAYKDYNTANQDYLHHDLIRVILAQEWMRRVHKQSEVEVAYLLIAILLLHETSRRSVKQLQQVFPPEVLDWRHQWQREATAHIQMMGQRALRSIHSEIIARRWLHNSFARTDGMWYRLQNLKPMLQTNLPPNELRTILRYCYIVELRDHDLLLPIAHSLRVAIGDPVNIYKDKKWASVVERLLDIHRTLPISSAMLDKKWLYNLPPLHRQHIKIIKSILNDIEHYAWNIVLLDPLPFLQPEKSNDQD